MQATAQKSIRLPGSVAVDPGKGAHLSRSWHFAFCSPAIFIFVLATAAGFGQDAPDARGFADIQLGAPVSTIPFPCNHPEVCESPDEFTWVRIWHREGLIWRVDVIYSGRALDIEQEIQSSPITLPQAIRSHSIRYGRNAPLLGLAGNDAGLRIIVDTANGIAYFAEGAYPGSLVKEVRYLPAADSLAEAASRRPLTEHGKWLVTAAWSAPRYKNLSTDSDTIGRERAPEDKLGHGDALIARLQERVIEDRSLAATTLMLSARVSESLKRQEKPDHAVAAQLKKAVVLMSAAERDAQFLIKDHLSEVAPAAMPSLPLDLALEAKSRMQELVREGFVE